MQRKRQMNKFRDATLKLLDGLKSATVPTAVKEVRAFEEATRLADPGLFINRSYYAIGFWCASTVAALINNRDLPDAFENKLRLYVEHAVAHVADLDVHFAKVSDLRNCYSSALQIIASVRNAIDVSHED